MRYNNDISKKVLLMECSKFEWKVYLDRLSRLITPLDRRLFAPSEGESMTSLIGPVGSRFMKLYTGEFGKRFEES